MDFIQVIFGKYILESLGALIRYIYVNLIGLIKNKNHTSFSNIWSPNQSTIIKNENSTLNHMIGVILFGIIIVLVIIFTT